MRINRGVRAALLAVAVAVAVGSVPTAGSTAVAKPDHSKRAILKAIL